MDAEMLRDTVVFVPSAPVLLPVSHASTMVTVEVVVVVDGAVVVELAEVVVVVPALALTLAADDVSRSCDVVAVAEAVTRRRFRGR